MPLRASAMVRGKWWDAVKAWVRVVRSNGELEAYVSTEPASYVRNAVLCKGVEGGVVWLWMKQ